MEENQFEYTYSAPDQEEIRKIREKYLPKEQYISKLDQLKKMDADAEKPGMILSLSLGIIGTLMLGFGMSCTTVMTEFFVLGIVIGVLGLIVMGIAFPVYKKVTKKQREKIAEEIIRLSDELMQ